MARAKKTTLVKTPEDQSYYIALADYEIINDGTERYPEKSKDVAISALKENEGEVSVVLLYEVKLLGKYKVKYELEKID